MNPRTRWILVVLAALAGLGLFIGRGQMTDPDPEPEPTVEDVRFPMPKAEPTKSQAEQARGLYTLQRGVNRFSLDLQSGSRFRLVSSKSGTPVLVALGTWSLTGTRLTLNYTAVEGRPEVSEKDPQVAVNRWFGNTIELLETGLPGRVLLKKQTMLRQK